MTTAGGELSHEFHLALDIGDDDIATCSSCSYAANIEKASGQLFSRNVLILQVLLGPSLLVRIRTPLTRSPLWR